MTPRRFDEERASERVPHPTDHRGLNWGPICGLALCVPVWATVLLLWWASRVRPS
jgi:hypothetical protein